MTTQKESLTESLTLKVYGRPKNGKSASFRTRLGGRVPGVVYGPKVKTPFSISVIPNELKPVYTKAGHTGLVTLQAMDGAPTELNGAKVLLKEVQVHPYKNLYSHIDLHQIDLDRSIRVTVPLKFVGKAKGQEEGGVVSIMSREVEIKCLPTNIPNHIDIDISPLEINGSIHIAELAEKMKSEKYEFMFESDFALVAVVEPQEEKAAVAVAADPAAATPAAGAKAAAAPAAAAPKKADKK